MDNIIVIIIRWTLRSASMSNRYSVYVKVDYPETFASFRISKNALKRDFSKALSYMACTKSNRITICI